MCERESHERERERDVLKGAESHVCVREKVTRERERKRRVEGCRESWLESTQSESLHPGLQIDSVLPVYVH